MCILEFKTFSYAINIIFLLLQICVFQNISNLYMILKEIEKNIINIIFLLSNSTCNENLDYIINCVFKNLIPLGYNLNIKYVADYKDFFDTYRLEKVA